VREVGSAGRCLGSPCWYRACYQASRRLPGPDFHRQATTSLRTRKTHEFGDVVSTLGGALRTVSCLPAAECIHRSRPPTIRQSGSDSSKQSSKKADVTPHGDDGFSASVNAVQQGIAEMPHAHSRVRCIVQSVGTAAPPRSTFRVQLESRKVPDCQWRSGNLSIPDREEPGCQRHPAPCRDRLPAEEGI